MSFFKKLHYSMARVCMYPKMMKQGVGKAFLYLFLFTAIFGTVHAVVTGYQVNNGLDKFSELVNKELPEFSLENGTLYVEGEMPKVLVKNKDFIAVIDTRDNPNTNVLDDYDSGMLLLKHRMIQKENPMQTSEIAFQHITIPLSKEKVMGWLPLLHWIGVFVGGLAWVGFFLGKMASALFLALIGLLAAAIFKRNLPFGQLYSTGIYAITTPALLDLIFEFFSIELHFLIYFLIAMIYVFLAVRKTNLVTQ